MIEKHAVVIVRRQVDGKEMRIPFVGRITGMRNPEDQREVEFMAWTRRKRWQKIYIPQDAIASMATFISEFKDVGLGI